MKHLHSSIMLLLFISIVPQSGKSQIISVPQVPFTPATFTPSTFTPTAPPTTILMVNQRNNGEGVYPTHDVTIERKISIAYIEEDVYNNITIKLKAGSDVVKLIVKDAYTGAKIYKKRFANSYLYCFPGGDIMVGKGDALTKVIISKDKEKDMWWANIKAGGIY